MNDLTPPKPSPVDHAATITKGAVSSFPGGSLATSFFDTFFGNPIERRRSNWMESVAHAIRHLQDESRVTEERLSQNEAFLDVLYGASALACRTANEAKLEALKNLVLYAALNHEIDGAVEHIVLRLASQCSELHIALLLALHSTTLDELATTRPYLDFFALRISDFCADDARWKMVMEDFEKLDLYAGAINPQRLPLSPIATELAKRLVPPQ